MAEIRDRIRELRRVKAGELQANPLNFREHDEYQTNVLKSVLDRIGYADALLAREDEDGVLHLIDGHLRASLDAEHEVPVLILDVDADEANELLATIDPLAGLATINSDKLTALTDSILPNVEGDDVATAFISDLVGKNSKAAANVDEDKVPEPPADPVTQPGDLWTLGRHRLICGDSTDEDIVRRLMGEERAGLMNTDPPYGVSYANAERPNPGVAKPRVANDELQDDELQGFLEQAFGSAVEFALRKNAAWYLWHAHLTQGYFAAAAAAANVVLHRQIIWVKPVLLLGRGQYHWKHEPCFMGWVKGHQPPDYGAGNGERNQTTVWELGNVSQAERKEFNHPTPKPVKLFEIPIVKHLEAGEVCYEPFAGSGPQFIAAEQLNRRCFGIELSPAYCDVIVERWQNLTGEKATRESA